MGVAESSPLVSVVIPAYNAARFVAATVESVLAQIHPGLECIVVDDGSTDETPEVLAGFGDRIRVLRQANAGQATARNHGARVARGQLLAFLDSDDLWDPGMVSHQLALLQRFPDAVAVYCDHRTVDAQGRTVAGTTAQRNRRPSGQVLHALLLGTCITTPGVVMVRRAAFETAGGFDEAPLMRWGGEDAALWLRLALVGPIIYSPETLMSYRLHERQATREEQYRLRKGLTSLHSLLSVRAQVAARGSPDLDRLMQWRLFEARLAAAWSARHLGRRGQAIGFALQALGEQPCASRAWRTLLATLLPARRLDVAATRRAARPAPTA